MKIRLFFALLSLPFLLLTSLAAETEQRVPGTQFVESVELPASTSSWNYSLEKMKNIGEPRPLHESKTETVRYWIFLPVDYEKQAAEGGAPLLLFLHGAGERGSTPEEIDKVKVHGPPMLLQNDEIAKHWPCVTVSPQCRNDFAWSPAQLMLLLDHIEREYKVDRSRIYVTGISMGGFGTWMCLRENPKRFAAAAPICGGAKPEWAPLLKEIPIWNFHGDRDFVVPTDFSRKIVDAIRKEGGQKIILTIYRGVDHNSWTRTYENQLLSDWLFQQRIDAGR